MIGPEAAARAEALRAEADRLTDLMVELARLTVRELPPDPRAAEHRRAIAMPTPKPKASTVRTPCQDDPDLWVSDSPQLRAAAVQKCAPCPRKADCLTEALERRETFGVYGARDFTRTKAGKATGGGPSACANCGTPIRQPKQGNRRKYCSEHCGYLARRAS